MKKILHTILLIILTNNILAQERDNRTVEVYHYNVNLAELAIINEDWNLSLDYYMKAFETNHFFTADLYNTILVTLMCNDSLNGRLLYNELALLGQEAKYLHVNFDMENSATKNFVQYISQDYDSIRNIVLTSEMPYLAKKIDILYNLDQACRTDSVKKKDLYNCDNAVLELLNEYIDSFGFPSQYKVGMMEVMMLQPYNTGVFDLIFRHQRSANNDKITEIAYNAVMKGEYAPELYAHVADIGKMKYYSFLPSDPITKKELEAINTERAKIYLEPLEDYYKKIKYRKNYQGKMKFHFIAPLNFVLNYEAELIIRE